MDSSIFLQLLLPGLTTGCVYALVALGFVLCANVSGVVNFAQGEFVMLGGMAAAWLIGLDVPFALAVLAATAIGATVGAAQEFFTLAPVRLRPHFIQITTTVGFAVVLRGITLIVAGKDALSLPGFSGDGVIVLLGAIVPVQSLWVWGATLLLLLGTFTFLRYTSIGRAVRACSINLQAARLMGVNAERLRVIVFGVSGATGALAGVVITPIVLASWDAGLTYSTKGFIGAILGGFRSPSIAVLGGLFIGVLESLGAGYVSSGWKDFIVYGALLAWLLIQGGVFLRGRAGVAAGGQ
ncbi:MAG: branched-chain amino acid ABC transporter permease [Acetobacteraceae bacterium]|jgi:branched-chain amino acid transport system permease protein